MQPGSLENLEAFVMREIERLGMRVVSAAAAQLSTAYRTSPQPALRFDSDAARIAYLAVRMPATHAAVSAALGAVRERIPNLHVESMLDLGAGPATAAFAARALFPGLSNITLLERDRELAALGESLMREHSDEWNPQREWRYADLSREMPAGEYDLVTISFALGELSEAEQLLAVDQAWDRCRQALVIVEPGTTAGFENILRARARLSARGARLVAPCPHELACPLSAPDWCHFVVRLQRSRAHMAVKRVTLPYEDEKFSYVAFARADCAPVDARVITRPDKHKGHVRLTLCTTAGVNQTVVSARNKSEYKQARKLEWGDSWSQIK